MSERDSGGTRIGNAIAMAVIIFALVMFFIVVAIVTFLASPGMLIVGSAKLAFGLTHSGRQVWVLSVALSLTILIVLVLAFRDLAKGVATHFLLCCVTMISWSVLTYGFESRAAEQLAGVFFPGFTIKEAPAASAVASSSGERSVVPQTTAPEGVQGEEHEGGRVSMEFSPVVAPRAGAVAPLQAEALPAPTATPVTTFRVALRLPLKRAFVMVRLNDREVFRVDFRPGDQDGTPELVTPPIEAVAGTAEVKVWVISPDKKVADEYVVLPVELGAGENRRLGLVLDPGRDLKARLLVEPI